MPLHVPPAPAPALRSVLTALSSPTAVSEARTPSLLVAQGPASPELPLPVHVLDRTTPDAGTATRLAGWRFLIRTGDRSVAAADTVLLTALAALAAAWAVRETRGVMRSFSDPSPRFTRRFIAAGILEASATRKD